MTHIKITYFDVLPNYGDALNEWFLTNVAKVTFEKCKDQHNEDHYVLFGSILHCTTKHSTVWGSGLISPEYGIDPDAKILCVRGPISKKHAKRDVPVGDPALLLPLYFPNTFEKKYEVSICPHYVDYQHIIENNPKNYHVINMLDPVEKVTQEILESKVIYSSSLHGIIVSDAYGIPNSWIGAKNEVCCQDFKFADYLSSVNRPQRRYMYENLFSGAIKPSTCSRSLIKTLQNNLISTCPFKI